MAEEANPVDFLPNHPPRTELEQLQAALEAGLITPALFALAKEKLLNASAPPPPEAPPQPSRPTAPPASQSNEASSGELPPLMSFFNDTPPTPAAPPTPAPARVAPPSAPSQPEARPSSPPIFRAEPPVAPASHQPVAPPTPTPRTPAPAVDFLGASATPPPAAAPRPAPTPPPNFIPSQPDVYADLLATAAPTPPPPSRPVAPAKPAATAEPRRSVMPKVLLALGIVGLLLLIYWQVSGSHPDEQLTSPRLPANSENVVAPTTAKAPSTKKRSTKSTKSKKRKAKKNKELVASTDSAIATPPPAEVRPQAKPKAVATTVAAKPTSPAKAAVASTPVGTEAPPPDVVPRAVPPAPEAGDTEAALKVRATMAGYYADMLAPPFTAARHFAPRVERLYIQQNLTPSDIDDRFNRNFFPDNKKAVLQIEPGTLRVSAPASDGTCMATFVEDSYVYHPSRQLYQRMRAQVRARFDANFKIVYLRQERLLESTVE